MRTARVFDERNPSRIDPAVSICVSVPIGLSRQPRQVSTMVWANDYRRQGVTSSVRNSPSVSVTKSSHARARGLIDYGVYGARVLGTVAESPSRGISSGLAALPASGENISRGDATNKPENCADLVPRSVIQTESSVSILNSIPLAF